MQLVYPFTADEYLGGFQVLALKSTSARNISLEVFQWTYVSISLEMPRSEIKMDHSFNTKREPTKLLQQHFPVELSIMRKMLYYPVTFSIIASIHMWLIST